MVATGRRENLVWIVEAGSSSLQSYRGKYQLWEKKGGIILMYGGKKGQGWGSSLDGGWGCWWIPQQLHHQAKTSRLLKTAYNLSYLLFPTRKILCLVGSHEDDIPKNTAYLITNNIK